MKLLVVASAVLFSACVSAGTVTQPAMAPQGELMRVEAVLDRLHQAAARAEEEQYFALFSEEAVFFGTDATERWPIAAFRQWAHPYFAKGKAWTFTPSARNVFVSAGGTVAWFDEALESAAYGECRGSGVLQKRAGAWKIEQYNLTIPIPNELADEFVKRIRERTPPGLN